MEHSFITHSEVDSTTVVLDTTASGTQVGSDIGTMDGLAGVGMADLGFLGFIRVGSTGGMGPT